MLVSVSVAHSLVQELSYCRYPQFQGSRILNQMVSTHGDHHCPNGIFCQLTKVGITID